MVALGVTHMVEAAELAGRPGLTAPSTCVPAAAAAAYAHISAQYPSVYNMQRAPTQTHEPAWTKARRQPVQTASAHYTNVHAGTQQPLLQDC